MAGGDSGGLLSRYIPQYRYLFCEAKMLNWLWREIEGGIDEINRSYLQWLLDERDLAVEELLAVRKRIADRIIAIGEALDKYEQRHAKDAHPDSSL